MIDGKAIRLLAFEPEHWTFIQNWKGDPRYKYFFRNMPEIMTVPQMKQLPQIMNMNILMAGTIHDNMVVGMVTYDNIRLVARSCQMGMLIDHACQGKGFTKDMHMTFIHYLFGQLGFHKIIANIAAAEKHVHSKIEWGGFQKEATLRDEYFMDGAYHDDVRYVAFARGFAKRYLKYIQGESSWVEAKAVEAEACQDKQSLATSCKPSSILAH